MGDNYGSDPNLSRRALRLLKRAVGDNPDVGDSSVTPEDLDEMRLVAITFELCTSPALYLKCCDCRIYILFSA